MTLYPPFLKIKIMEIVAKCRTCTTDSISIDIISLAKNLQLSNIFLADFIKKEAINPY